MNNQTGLEYMYNQNCQTEHILTFKLLKQYLRYSQKETPGLFSWEFSCEFSCNQLAIEKALHAIGYNQIPTK